MNRFRILSFVTAGVLLVPGALAAQAPGGQAPQTSAPATSPGNDADLRTANFFDGIVRGTSFAPGSDEARFQRYRDLRDGGTVDVFRYRQDTESKFVSASADHIGYRDQRYAVRYNNYGRLKASF